MKRLCVFCGSNRGREPIYARAAQELGTALVRRGWGLVYGGGHVGLMGTIADAVLEAGGEVVGVIPQALVDKELAHRGLTTLHVTVTMHERKALMADLSDAFAALPGAYGTADELFEILTWAQLGLHTKPIGILNVAGFFDPLLAWVDKAVSEEFLKRKHRERLFVAENAEELLDRLLNAEPVEATSKWIVAKDR